MFSILNAIYSCEAKLFFHQSFITPIFSVTWSFRNHSKYVDLVIKKHLSLLLWMLKTVVNVSVSHSKDNDNNYLWLAFAQITSTDFLFISDYLGYE